MTKNIPKVIKRIEPEKRSRQKKKVSSNGKHLVFFGVTLAAIYLKTQRRVGGRWNRMTAKEATTLCQMF